MTDDSKLSLRAEAIIRDAIITGRFAFGARLSDRVLAEELEISRTPVREALSRLAQEDLVVVRPQSGTFVMDLDATDLRRICEMRAVLELGALRIAAASDADALVAAVSIPLSGGALALEDGDLARADVMDTAFHEALVGAAANPLLTRAYRGIADQVGAIRHRLPREISRMRAAVEQHRRIIDLAVTGRLVDAEAQLSTHVRIVEKLATDFLFQQTKVAGRSRRRSQAPERT
ncbi:GntR family transcriptional regulator [Methylobacterium brachythecii]|uniref:Transcriptional regulator n=1 Tax=Methylobacterium brachythecii TaxID=1176177 RepID=A0A7W6AP13_9HYPH|nr:GntR family transcriptional regulator [Methylobacterium brachythecii]MBB3904096.1 DNA-binding GntR family transcriptional regulator [Methylobacterium brachythecii]GLS42837.1 transcriptional regulator [Methylobacterium brachythecii]